MWRSQKLWQGQVFAACAALGMCAGWWERVSRDTDTRFTLSTFLMLEIIRLGCDRVRDITYGANLVVIVCLRKGSGEKFL